MLAAVRGALIVVGLLIMAAGLAAVVGLQGVGVAGLLWVGSGAVLVVAVLFERQRYRSETAERSNGAPGPGGGEPAAPPLDPRFRPTTEVFVDPTTGTRMRVVVDPKTGERRYVAEG